MNINNINLLDYSKKNLLFKFNSTPKFSSISMNYLFINTSINYKNHSNPNAIAYEHFYFLQILILLFILLGNGLIILLIRLNKSLYANNTLLIVLSLSVTDLLLSIMVLPFTFYSQLLYPKWNLGFAPCVLWLSSDIQLTTTSIFHLCSITYERYLSIARPVQFRINIRKRILTIIVFNWTFSFLTVTLPFLALIAFRPNLVYRHDSYCFLFSSFFVAYTTLITFWIPLVLMVFFGLRAVYLIRKIDKSHIKMNPQLSIIGELTPRNSYVESDISKESKNSTQNLTIAATRPCSSTENLSVNKSNFTRNRSYSLNYQHRRKNSSVDFLCQNQVCL